MISIKELIHRLSRRIRDCARCLPSEREAKDFYLSALVHFTTPVRLRSDICSRNLFILFLVFMVCEIEERKKAEEHGVQPAKEQYRPSDDCSSSEETSVPPPSLQSLSFPQSSPSSSFSGRRSILGLQISLGISRKKNRVSPFSERPIATSSLGFAP